jgi:hypothetical protein
VTSINIRALSNHSIGAAEQKFLWSNLLDKYPAPIPGTPIFEAEYLYFLASDSDSTLKNVPAEVFPYPLDL